MAVVSVYAFNLRIAHEINKKSNHAKNLFSNFWLVINHIPSENLWKPKLVVDLPAKVLHSLPTKQQDNTKVLC